MNDPTKDCIFKTPKHLWKLLPPHKSLFNNEGYGLPIGNLTSQWFANFFLTEFDLESKKKYPYGRYVDDFWVITKSKKECREYFQFAKKYLKENLDINIHSDKIYIQHYSKGVYFIGAILKNNRAYISNRVVASLYEKKDGNVNSINSYLGAMSHYMSYNIVKKIKFKDDIKFKKNYVVYRA